MTFPIIELLCPECEEAMTLINTPEMKDSNKEGYNKFVEWHYQCKAMKEICVVLKIYIPDLKTDKTSPIKQWWH